MLIFLIIDQWIVNTKSERKNRYSSVKVLGWASRSDYALSPTSWSYKYICIYMCAFFFWEKKVQVLLLLLLLLSVAPDAKPDLGSWVFSASQSLHMLTVMPPPSWSIEGFQDMSSLIFRMAPWMSGRGQTGGWWRSYSRKKGKDARILPKTMCSSLLAGHSSCVSPGLQGRAVCVQSEVTSPVLPLTSCIIFGRLS